MKKKALLLLALVLCSCRVVPIQVGRVILLESFCQDFEFEGQVPEEKEANIDTTLNLLLGSENYNELKIREPRLDRLKQGFFQSCGTVSIALSVVPNSILSRNQFKFSVSGQGRFFIIMEEKGRIYYSVDFRLLQEHHDAEELAKGTVKIRLQQQVVTDLQQVRDLIVNRSRDGIAKSSNKSDIPPPNFIYGNTAIIEVSVKIDTSLARENVYSIAYESKHEVRVANKRIGYLTFDKPYGKYDKIMDFKGIRYLRNRY